MDKINAEIRNILNLIEIESDNIVKAKNLEVTDTVFDALRDMKESVSSIEAYTEHSGGDSASTYLVVLKRILMCVRGASRFPEVIDLYAERVREYIENYFMLNAPYNEEYEQRKDKEIEVAVSARRSVIQIEKIKASMKAIADQKVREDCPVGSPRYNDLTMRYNTQQMKLRAETHKLNHIHKVINENNYIHFEIERALTLDNMENMRNLSLDSFAELLLENKERELEEQATHDAFDALVKENMLPDYCAEIDDHDFQKAIEETLLEGMYKEHTEDYRQQIAAFSDERLLDSVMELSRKIDMMSANMSATVGAQKAEFEKKFEELSELFSRTMDAAALREDIGGDIEKEIEYCLSRNPMDIQSASLKLRNCIELYCRFAKGVDLNDSILFAEDPPVVDKLIAAGITDNCKVIAGIYKNTNKFIHGSLEVLCANDSEKEKTAKLIRDNVKKLKKMGVDKYNLADGVALFYRNQDQMIKKKIDEKNIDGKYYEREKTKQIRYYFERMEQLAEYMRTNGIAVPEIRFRSPEDILDYINKVTAKSFAPYNQNSSTGKITNYNDKNGYGSIDNKISFCIEDFSKRTNYKVGDTVSYNTEKRNFKVTAKDIRVISEPEKA